MTPTEPVRSPPRPPSTAGAIVRFLAGSVAAILVVVVGAFFVLRHVAIDEAQRDTREQVQLEGRLVEAAGLQDGVVRGDPAALARLDDLVAGRVLSDSVVRVKLWTRGGRILYSDQPALIGRDFGLAARERELFDTGGADAKLSDLSAPENEYERQEGKLLEAHTVIRTPDGTEVLFETYKRFGSVSASAKRLLGALAPPLLGGVLVLLLAQVPLAWRLARRLQRGHRDRERLLAGAVEASTQERRRIASDLHDGVVQDLAGVAFGLAPVAAAAHRRGDEPGADVLDEAIDRLRQGQRDLRTLLVEIHPPSLETAGLEAALGDLLSPLRAAGVATDLEMDAGAVDGTPADALVYRVTREALRNVTRHAGAGRVAVRVGRPRSGVTHLEVEDDGRGFDDATRDRSAEEGHVGLTLLQDLVGLSGGTLQVRSRPGAGTTLELEVPDR